MRIARRAYLERCAGEATLRCVHDRADFPTQIVVFCVADDADNFVAGRRFTLARFGLAEAFSQRILFPNKLRDERLVHNHWRWYRMRRRTVRYTCERIGGNLIVRGSEIAAGHEWYLHGAEEIRAYLQRVGFRLAILRRSRPVKHRSHQRTLQQRDHGVACRLHSRRFRKAPLQITVKAANLRILITCKRRVDSENHEIVRIEPHVSAAQVLQCSYQ